MDFCAAPGSQRPTVGKASDVRRAVCLQTASCVLTERVHDLFHVVSQRSQVGPCQTVGRHFQPLRATAVRSGSFNSSRLNE